MVTGPPLYVRWLSGGCPQLHNLLFLINPHSQSWRETVTIEIVTKPGRGGEGLAPFPLGQRATPLSKAASHTFGQQERSDWPYMQIHGKRGSSPMPGQPTEPRLSAPCCIGARPPQTLLETLLTGLTAHSACLSKQPPGSAAPSWSWCPCGSHKRMATQMGSAGGQQSLACGSAKCFS